MDLLSTQDRFRWLIPARFDLSCMIQERSNQYQPPRHLFQRGISWIRVSLDGGQKGCDLLESDIRNIIGESHDHPLKDMAKAGTFVRRDIVKIKKIVDVPLWKGFRERF